MKPVDFTLHRPAGLDEAMRLLAEQPDEAKVLAGGQSLLPLLNFRLARPDLLVDLGRVGGLSDVRTGDTGLRIGAMVRHSTAEYSQLVRRSCPLIADALPSIAHPAIRNRGTVGGSLAHADPAAELPAVAVALDASFVAHSVRGVREIPAAEFFRTHLTTALEADEILTEVRFPVSPPATGTAFVELARRQGDFALVGVAVQLTVEGTTISSARVALSGVSDVPYRGDAAERLLRGTSATTDVLDAVAEATRSALYPTADLHATAEYRRHLAGVLLVRAVRDAYARACEAAGALTGV